MQFSVEGLSSALGFGYHVLVWGIGILAMVLSVISFQFKRGITIVFCNFLGQSSWVAYFLLQGDLASAIACGLSALMLAVFSRKERWKWATGPISIAVFLVLLTGFSLLSFQGWTDIFPLLAGIFAVIANSRKTEKRLRQYSLLWYLFWLLNSILKRYPVALVNDLLCTVSTVVSLVRYGKKPDSSNS